MYSRAESNCRPTRCKRVALTTELLEPMNCTQYSILARLTLTSSKYIIIANLMCQMFILDHFSLVPNATHHQNER